MLFTLLLQHLAVLILNCLNLRQNLLKNLVLHNVVRYQHGGKFI